MKRALAFADFWARLGPKALPFADAASADLPLARLLRLSLFHLPVALALVLLNGTLNRVMIVEMSVPASLVAAVIAVPVLFAPLRALVGHRSDQFRSYLGWRRVPFLWLGTLVQFGGFSIMPFALLLLTEQAMGPAWMGEAATALAFLLVGAGMHMIQTAGLALATDLAPEGTRPRVIALLYVTLLLGMLLSAWALGALLADYSPLRLIQVVQGAALFTMVVNLVATWKQEPRQPELTRPDRVRTNFRQALTQFGVDPAVRRVLIALALGTMAFSMQDVLLEPYGAQILALSVAETTRLTGVFALGTLIAFALAARRLQRGGNEYRLAGVSVLVGIAAFCLVIFAAPLGASRADAQLALALFVLGTFLIGFGAGLFSLSMLFAVMHRSAESAQGLALGIWGSVQATALGVGLAAGGFLRDFVSRLSADGLLGETLALPYIGYSFVYHCEVLLLFATVIAIGPLVRIAAARPLAEKFGLVELPG